jgi:hypothetical protein
MNFASKPAILITVLTPFVVRYVVVFETPLCNIGTNTVTHLVEDLNTRIALRPSCPVNPKLVVINLVEGVALGFDCLERHVIVSVGALARPRVWRYADVILG